MIENHSNQKSQKQFIKLLKSTDERMVETASGLLLSEITGIPVVVKCIHQTEVVFKSLMCDLKPDVIFLFNTTDKERKFCTCENQQ